MTSKAKAVTDVVTENNGRKFTHFPRFTVLEVAEFPQVIINASLELSRDEMCSKLGKGAKSSATKAAIAAAKAYKLIENKPNGVFDVTQLGRDLCNESEAQRNVAIAQACANIDHFKNFFNAFSKKQLPNADVASGYLQRNMGFVGKEADVFYDVVTRNARDAGLIDQTGKYPILNMLDSILVLDGSSDLDKESISPVTPIVKSEKAEQQKNQQKILRTEVCVNVQIMIPDNASSETIDNIFESMARHLRIAE